MHFVSVREHWAKPIGAACAHVDGRQRRSLSTSADTQASHSIHAALPSDALGCHGVIGRSLGSRHRHAAHQEFTMFSAATPTAPTAVAHALTAAKVPDATSGASANQRASRHITDILELLNEKLAPQRRVVHAGDVLYQSGERFGNLYVLNSGFFKIVNLSTDGREQVVGLKFRGDWLGFDGIATIHYGCDAIAMDTGEVWTIRYDALLQACTAHPALLTVLHEAMSREIARDRDSLMSVCTLPADARVADFLRYWADSLAKRGLRTDQITLRMTRAEIGNYLGMTLETVSRALSKLARENVIGFTEKGRRDVQIPDVAALSAFVQRSLAPASTLLQ
jgi:CRP/FNR family transcriptional regulator